MKQTFIIIISVEAPKEITTNMLTADIEEAFDDSPLWNAKVNTIKKRQ